MKKAMSITQTYFLAHKARAKLSHEAARPDHNLRLLVGHANLLDSLMLDLADAEREQESWFTQSVRGASPAPSKTEERHIQWADSAVEEDWEADSSDSDSDSDDDSDIEMEDVDVAPTPLSRIPSHAALPSSPILQTMDTEFDDDDDEEEEEDYSSLTLTRSQSRVIASPPELDHDSDSSDDESMPPSPPTATIPSFSQKQRETTVTTKYLDPRQEEEEEDDKPNFYNDGYYLPPRNPPQLVSAITVY
ncbi:hypothetical protein SLS62_004526 [Diatrype stigma]|uniref:Protein ECM13 n=1 Tax=Diatrype stigma TaxID=117547 RepID=A0AAN9UU41_9PEZI